nr:MAG TPA: helix-turn-helix domain protein [Caudoviricetes sp.]
MTKMRWWINSHPVLSFFTCLILKVSLLVIRKILKQKNTLFQMMKEIKQNKKQDRPTRSGLLLFLHLTASSVELIIGSTTGLVELLKGVLFMEEISLDGFSLVNLTAASTLHQKRLVLELTQQQVADRAGVDIQQYRKFESGARDIRRASFDVACRVIRALEMDVGKFFDGEYSLGEEIYSENGELKYKKTGRSTKDNIDG